MRGLGVIGLWVSLGLMFLSSLIILVLVRVTTPRLRVETLTRLGWLLLLAQIGGMVGCFIGGF